MIGTLKNHVVQTVGVLLVTLVILLNCCPRGFCQTETSTEKEARLTALLLAPSIPNARAYQCTFCKRFHAITRELVIYNFVDRGNVRFLFKDYPINDISPTNSSTLAAEASYCAADQLRYWEYHNELYYNWRGENTGWVSPESLQKIPELVTSLNFQIASAHTSIQHWYSQNYDLAIS
ncbi:MAG: DsbA family protein [Nitrososphaerales archaeon]